MCGRLAAVELDRLEVKRPVMRLQPGDLGVADLDLGGVFLHQDDSRASQAVLQAVGAGAFFPFGGLGAFAALGIFPVGEDAGFRGGDDDVLRV